VSRTVTIVNLRSDTQTRPTEEMRRVMAAAEVGDEQYFLDPTVTELCERVAALLGQEAAVFLPSGTMCNHIGLRLHIRPGGDEIILHRSAHPIMAESGSPAALTGAMVNPLDSDDGTFTADQVRGALRQVGNRYQPVSRLVHVEQTTNLMGGRVWPSERLEAVLGVAAEHGLRTHLDGARLMNAVVASGVSAAGWASLFDTAWIDFTKGLGAPLGACLAGSTELIEEAWRWKQMMGGSMRQAGIVAAGALYALDHNVERLADDHALARTLADRLAEIPGVRLDPDVVETNIVVFGVDDAFAVSEALGGHDVWIGALDATTLRAVTHLDVDAAGVERALRAMADVLG
jgi:threonine aldolase